MFSSPRIPFLLLLLPLIGVRAQSSTSSISASSSASSVSGTSASASGNSTRTVSGSGSGSSSVSASTTNTADLPSLSGYNSCVTTCFDTAVADAGCISLVDSTCYCNSANYTTSLLSCIQSSCPSSLATAEGLTEKFCAIATSGTTSVSFSVTSFTSASSSAATTSTRSGSSASGTGSGSGSVSEITSSGTTGASNAASRASRQFFALWEMEWIGMGLTMMGVVAGALLV